MLDGPHFPIYCFLSSVSIIRLHCEIEFLLVTLLRDKAVIIFIITEKFTTMESLNSPGILINFP